jgi:PEP-CTERM motif
MLIRNSAGLVVVAIVFVFCPSLSAVSYNWNFTGAAGSNCTAGARGSCSNPGNSIVFTTPGGPTVTATAWYVNGNGTLQQAALGQYSSGLGVCYQSTTCTQQVDFDEYVLLQFSAPVDPSSVTITSSTGGGLDASYWLGSSAGQNMNLTGRGMSSLTSLGFGSMTNSTGGSGGTRAVDFTGAPGGTVNAILFGSMYGYGSDFFDVQGMTGTFTSSVSVPEPSSVILLFTIALLGLGLSRKAFRKSPLVKNFKAGDGT